MPEAYPTALAAPTAGPTSATTCPTLTPVGARGWVENKPEYFGP